MEHIPEIRNGLTGGNQYLEIQYGGQYSGFMRGIKEIAFTDNFSVMISRLNTHLKEEQRFITKLRRQ